MPETPENFELISEHACFGGVQRFYKHLSAEIGLPMRFGVFLPAKALAGEPVPLVTFLAGLTCTEETFAMKAGAQRMASDLGLALLMPDTSPRNTGVDSEDHHWDFGVGAGFYLDATQAPWSGHWCMESYLLKELLPAAIKGFGFDAKRLGIFGHSMGGHGALTLALRHPGQFQSVSAFAPICAPTQCPWGHKAFTGYLGQDETTWAEHDASALMASQATAPYPAGILIDQGLVDKFLAEQLHSEVFEAACEKAGQPLQLRRHEGHDHGYYFISTFIEDHLRHHAAALGQ